MFDIDRRLKKAIEEWNNPKSYFTSTICTIFGHTRGINVKLKKSYINEHIINYSVEKEDFMIDEFTIDFFNDKTYEDKLRFIEFVEEEIKISKEFVNAITKEIDEKILNEIKNDWKIQDKKNHPFKSGI